LRKKIDRLISGSPDMLPLMGEVLQSIPQFEKDLRDMQKLLQSMPEEPKADPKQPVPEAPAPIQAMLAGMQKYTSVTVPVLAIFACPHAEIAGIFENDSVGRAKAEADDVARVEAQAKAIEKAAPSPHIVRIAHASHAVFMSNEADVLREMNAFLGSLPGA
jgi:hypothetical protein